MSVEIPALRRFRPGRPQGGVKQALLVVAAKAEALDGLEGGSAAGAAEALPGRRGKPAMSACQEWVQGLSPW